MPLHTKFHAIVDGTNGDTYLQPVEARLGESYFTCHGAVINVRGKGHIIDLDVTVPNGRIQDFLQLGVKTTPVVMTGRLAMKTKMHKGMMLKCWRKNAQDTTPRHAMVDRDLRARCQTRSRKAALI